MGLNTNTPKSEIKPILKRNKKRDMINTWNKTQIESPQKEIKEDKEKEFLCFLDNIDCKFDEELLNLTNLENVLINTKLDLKSEKDVKIANQEVFNSLPSENRTNLSSLESCTQYLKVL